MSRRFRPFRLAIIDNAIHPELYQPVEHWSRWLPVPFESFVAREGSFPDPSRFSHLILTGSEASILEPEPWVAEEADLVRRAVAAGLAVLGSCWGHQLIALALAGPEYVGRCARPEIGWIPIRILDPGGPLGQAGEQPYTFSFHFDEVRNLPGSFEVLAASDLCPVQAMRRRGRQVWGIQCHPEVDIPTGRKFLADMLEAGFKGRDFILEALASTPRDSGMISRIVAAFLGGPVGEPRRGRSA
jgi:GMP synthase-like glutamine amidotransferase